MLFLTPFEQFILNKPLVYAIAYRYLNSNLCRNNQVFTKIIANRN